MLITSVNIAKVVATSVVWRRGGAPKRLSACPPLEIIAGWPAVLEILEFLELFLNFIGS